MKFTAGNADPINTITLNPYLPLATGLAKIAQAYGLSDEESIALTRDVLGAVGIHAKHLSETHMLSPLLGSYGDGCLFTSTHAVPEITDPAGATL